MGSFHNKYTHQIITLHTLNLRRLYVNNISRKLENRNVQKPPYLLTIEVILHAHHEDPGTPPTTKFFVGFSKNSNFSHLLRGPLSTEHTQPGRLPDQVPGPTALLSPRAESSPRHVPVPPRKALGGWSTSWLWKRGGHSEPLTLFILSVAPSSNLLLRNQLKICFYPHHTDYHNEHLQPAFLLRGVPHPPPEKEEQ